MQADHTVMAGAEQQMNKAALRFAAMSNDLAAAKQVKEYDSDRRKRVLAICVTVFLEQGESAAAADARARGSQTYGDELLKLGLEYKSAMEVIEKADAAKILFEAARSLLAVERAKIGIL